MIQPTLMLVWTQAWQIAVLFFVVLFLFRLFARNRPRVAHLLWGVLLIKCLIPPVVSNSWAPFSWMSHTAQQWLPNDAAESTKITASATHSAQRTNSLRSQPTEEATSIKNANDSTKLNSSWPSHRSIAERWLFVFWIGSIAFVIAVWISRFAHVLHRLHVHRMETPARVAKIVGDLAQWLKLGRQVQIQVTSERIGPAVVGWLRPRVLLPSFLVDRMDDQALRILIAHELAHIRRGDLFWAFLQTVAGSLWWFHPAVWIANRQLNIESERSCDEETIARLKCSPSEYAKCLLQVLEWKHQLVVVPALPGVRPMQVTKDRLERIMKMRHGCYKHNSKGLWLAMVAAVLLVAPGAEYGISQQSTTTPQEPPNAAKQPIELQRGGAVVSDLGVAGQVVVDQPQAVQPPIALNAIHETRVYEVSDLLERIVADEASNSEEAPKDLERVLTCYETPAIPPAGITTLAASPSPAPPLPRPASLKPDGEFSFLDGKFTATTSEANHQRIETELIHYRKFGFKTILHVIACHELNQPIKLELKWEKDEAFEWVVLDSDLAANISNRLNRGGQHKRLASLRARNGDYSTLHWGHPFSLKPQDEINTEVVPNPDITIERNTNLEITSRLNQDNTLDYEIRLSCSDLSRDEGKTPEEKKSVFLSKSIQTKRTLLKDETILIRYFIPHPTDSNTSTHFWFLIQSKVEPHVPKFNHSMPDFDHRIFSPTIANSPKRL